MTLFLSYLLNAPVYDVAGVRIGRLRDFIVQQIGEQLPEVLGAIVRHNKRKIFVPMADIADISATSLTLRVPAQALPVAPPDEDRLYLKRDLLDAQVVDTHGAKVVRVNDILLSYTHGKLLASGLDIGAWGLMRRLGWAQALAKVVSWTHLKVPEGVIPWDTMQPIDKDPTRVHLKVSQDKLVGMHPADLADVIEELGHDQRSRLIEEMSNEQLADLIEEMEPEMQSSILQDLEPERAADVLEEMEPDEAADLLSELPEETAQGFITLMEPEEAAEVQHLLSFEEDTAGSMMTPSYVAVPEDVSVSEALRLFRTENPDAEVVAYFYLTDPNSHLAGVVSVRKILLAESQQVPMRELASQHLYSVRTDTPSREVADMVTRYNLTAVPVVDDQERLVGVVTSHDVLEEAREERSA